MESFLKNGYEKKFFKTHTKKKRKKVETIEEKKQKKDGYSIEEILGIIWNIVS